MQTPGAQSQSIVLGGGCFWCLEAAYQMVSGVTRVTPGYAGGHTTHPTFEQVASKTTGHAEVVRVEFDPAIIPLQRVLQLFWAIHDPTTKDRQGYDVGSEYRSIILYGSAEQQVVALASRDQAQSYWSNPVITEIKPLETFYEAEPEHHNYFAKNPNSAYCQIVINPKLAKLRKALSA